jgi:hypothetical protein
MTTPVWFTDAPLWVAFLLGFGGLAFLVIWVVLTSR